MFVSEGCMVDSDKVEGLIRHLRINIANHLIATQRLRAPRDYRDSFTVLNEAGILPPELTQTMRELAGLRNLLVHVYWDVDDEMIYEGIRAELQDFEAFVAHIMTFLQ
jgi:uncharacterized protein YutE (UPF0331/DUF86 family)